MSPDWVVWVCLMRLPLLSRSFLDRKIQKFFHVHFSNERTFARGVIVFLWWGPYLFSIICLLHFLATFSCNVSTFLTIKTCYVLFGIGGAVLSSVVSLLFLLIWLYDHGLYEIAMSLPTSIVFWDFSIPLLPKLFVNVNKCLWSKSSDRVVASVPSIFCTLITGCWCAI